MAETINDRVNRMEQSDPTALTSSQIFREVAALKELFDVQMESTDKAVSLRFNAMDKAVDLLQEAANRSPTISEVSVKHEEKFISIDKQFAERDVRTQQAADSSTTAVNAALQANKELNSKQTDAFGEATKKSEDQFTKQIDLNAELFRAEVRGLVAQIDELKDRFNRGEGVGAGIDKSQNSSRENSSYLIAVIGLAIAAAGLLIAFVLKP